MIWRSGLEGNVDGMMRGGGEGDRDHSFLGRDGPGDWLCACAPGGGFTFGLIECVLSSSSLSEDEDDDDDEEVDEALEDTVVTSARRRVVDAEAGAGSVTFFRASLGNASLSEDEEDDEDEEIETRLRFLFRARFGGILVRDYHKQCDKSHPSLVLWWTANGRR